MNTRRGFLTAAIVIVAGLLTACAVTPEQAESDLLAATDTYHATWLSSPTDTEASGARSEAYDAYWQLSGTYWYIEDSLEVTDVDFYAAMYILGLGETELGEADADLITAENAFSSGEYLETSRSADDCVEHCRLAMAHFYGWTDEESGEEHTGADQLLGAVVPVYVAIRVECEELLALEEEAFGGDEEAIDAVLDAMFWGW